MNHDNNRQPLEANVQPSRQAPAEIASQFNETQPVSLGPYAVEGSLGEGAMGRVYLATHTKLKQKFVLRILPNFRGRDVARIGRFTREMQVVGQLEHPNIVSVTGAGEEQGVQFIAMEFVDGLDVRRVSRNGPVDQAAACEIIRQTAAGLQSIHDNGLIHRDINPSNLMITQAGVVKILGLGIASLLSKEEFASSTVDGRASEMPDYIAPEQLVDADRTDIRADIYSLGCTLYRLLSGHAPFDGPNYNTPSAKVMGHLRVAPRPISELVELPPELVNVVQRMMEKDPDKRFQTPGEIVAAMCTWANGERLPQLILKESLSATAATAQRYRTSTPAFRANKSATATLVDSRWRPLPRLIAAGLLLTIATCIGGYVLSKPASESTDIPAEQFQVVNLESRETDTSGPDALQAEVPTAISVESASSVPEEPTTADEESITEPAPSDVATESQPQPGPSIDHHADQTVDATEPLRSADTSAEMDRDGQLIVNPKTDSEIYHNAREYARQGKQEMARASYLQLLNSGDQFIDVHKDFQSLLIQQEGIARAREIYMSNLNRENVTPTTELALVLLQELEIKLRGLVSLAQRHPDFAPAVYELNNFISQLPQEARTSAVQAQQFALLESLKQLHARDELRPYYLDQTEAGRIVQSIEDQFAVVALLKETEDAKRSLAAIKFSWVTFGAGENRGNLYFTNLDSHRSVISQVNYGLNTNKPHKTYQLPDLNSKDAEGLSIDVDDSVKFVVVRLTFTDGTQSQLVRIDRD